MQISPTLNFPALWLIVKFFFVIGLSIYAIFALVILRQVQIMSSTVKLKLDMVITFLALIHLLFAISLLIFAIITL